MIDGAEWVGPEKKEAKMQTKKLFEAEAWHPADWYAGLSPAIARERAMSDIGDRQDGTVESLSGHDPAVRATLYVAEVRAWLERTDDALFADSEFH